MILRSFLFLITKLLSSWYTVKGFICMKESRIIRREFIAHHDICRTLPAFYHQATQEYYGESDEELFLRLMNENLQNDDVEKNNMVDNVSDNTDEYLGAGISRPSLAPEDLVPLLMKALKNNDIPNKDAGLQSIWELTTDTTKYIFKNNITGKNELDLENTSS